MSAIIHPWNTVKRHSIFRRRRIGGGFDVIGELTCRRCEAVGEVACRGVMPPDQLAMKFTQKGWQVDGPLCPSCVDRPKEEKTMASAPSEAAVKSQARCFNLIGQHFDAEKGRYAKGWSDKKIAEECSLSSSVVATLRTDCFGELKESPEAAEIRADINALDTLCKEAFGQFQQQIAEIRVRLSRVEQ